MRVCAQAIMNSGLCTREKASKDFNGISHSNHKKEKTKATEMQKCTLCNQCSKESKKVKVQSAQHKKEVTS